MRNGMRLSKTLINTRDKGFQILVGVMIIILSIYIAIHSINIITSNKTKASAVNAIGATSNIIVNEIVDNSSIVTQYMLYMENHTNLNEDLKREILKSVVTEYINNSEYSYDTSDPGYNEVVDLIYASINTKGEVQEETTAEVTTTKKVEETTKKTIVPIPKATGSVYTAKNIGEFEKIISKYYTITSATTVKESDLPLKKAMEKKFEITGNNKKPQILIYHTHSQEEFKNSDSKDTSTTIIGVGNRLATILKEQFGYNVLHDTTKYDMVNGVLDRNAAYNQSREGVSKILKDNPTISLVLDIHRDGVNEDTHLVTTVNNKATATVMFFNGMSRFKESGDIGYLYNPYLFENLALSLQMKLSAEAYYPNFARRNYLNAYKYNLDLSKQCMLIEVGAQTNTYQEAKNAAEPLAVLIDKVLGKK